MFLIDGPEQAEVTILLAHGAGAPMDSASMNACTKALAAAGLRVVRFEFGYMATRRTSATKKPPPRAETLKPEYIAAIDVLGPTWPLIIGGKSMGGRVASMIAEAAHCAAR
jgi:predicted alpha/beta-hydrolase family hydrolase